MSTNMPMFGSVIIEIISNSRHLLFIERCSYHEVYSTNNQPLQANVKDISYKVHSKFDILSTRNFICLLPEFKLLLTTFGSRLKINIGTLIYLKISINFLEN